MITEIIMMVQIGQVEKIYKFFKKWDLFWVMFFAFFGLPLASIFMLAVAHCIVKYIFWCNQMTMKTKDLKDRVDGILMELHELENNATRLKQYAAKLTKSIYEINKRLHEIPIPDAIEEDDDSEMETFGKE